MGPYIIAVDLIAVDPTPFHKIREVTARRRLVR
jgi:hypothetical protein